MNADVTISLSLIFSLIAAFGVIVSISNVRKKDREHEEEKELSIEKNFVKINMKLDTICDTMQALTKKQEKDSDELRLVTEKLVKVEERIETLFRYKDAHDERLKNLENEKK